jgi:hypothetical protein
VFLTPNYKIPLKKGNMAARNPYLVHSSPPSFVPTPYKPPAKSMPISRTGGTGGTGPIEDPGTDYVLYHQDDFDGKNMIELVKKCGLSPRISFQDVRPIQQNDEKYPWFAKRNINYTPAIYECKTGKVHLGQAALNFIENQGKEFLEMQTANNNVNRRLVTDHGNKQVTPQEIFIKLDEIYKKLSEKDIEDAVFRTKVLSLLSKTGTVSSSSFQPAFTPRSTTGHGPREVSLGSSKLAGIDSRSPPSSPTAISPTKEEKARVVHGHGKMLAPIVMVPRTLDMPPPSRAINLKDIEESRLKDIDAWRMACDGAEPPTIFVDDHLYKTSKEEKKRDPRDQRDPRDPRRGVDLW